MSEKNQIKEKKQIKAVNPMLILLVILLLAVIATYIVPAGSFNRVMNKATGYETVNPSSYHSVSQNPVSIFGIFTSIPKGLSSSATLIFFLLIVGGVLQVIQATGAIEIGLKNLIKKLSGKETLLLVAILVTFGLLTCFAACSEEYLAFIPLVYMVCLGIGFDSLCAIFIVFGAATIGYAGGMTNAFTVGIAQTIAGLPLFSGIGYRTIVFIVLEIVSIIFICIYGTKIKKSPEKSIMYKIDQQYKEKVDYDSIPPLTFRHKIVLMLFVLGIAAMVIGIIKFGFYLTEMAGIFIIMAIACGIAGGMGANQICNEFVRGTKDLLWAGLIIGLCKAVTNVVSDANVMDTIIYALANSIKGLHSSVAACGLFVIQDIINLVIPSGSGQAAVTMPFMVPLGDLLGVHRQVNVLAFQFGDAFTNLITPASAKLMAGLAMCHIPYKKWIKFFLPIFIVWCIIACVLLVIATQIGWTSF